MLTLLFPDAAKFCKVCYRLNDNDIYLPSLKPIAWWTVCRECCDRR